VPRCPVSRVRSSHFAVGGCWQSHHTLECTRCATKKERLLIRRASADAMHGSLFYLFLSCLPSLFHPSLALSLFCLFRRHLFRFLFLRPAPPLPFPTPPLFFSPYSATNSLSPPAHDHRQSQPGQSPLIAGCPFGITGRRQRLPLSESRLLPQPFPRR